MDQQLCRFLQPQIFHSTLSLRLIIRLPSLHRPFFPSKKTGSSPNQSPENWRTSRFSPFRCFWTQFIVDNNDQHVL